MDGVAIAALGGFAPDGTHTSQSHIAADSINKRDGERGKTFSHCPGMFG